MSKRILINDPDPELVAHLQGILANQGRGFDLLPTTDGAAALEVVRRLPVDLVITGLDTPTVDGFELMTELTLQHRATKIIVLSNAQAPFPNEIVSAMGALRVFDEPLDLRAVTIAALEALGHKLKGEVWGLQLTSFLQMLNADRKTCTVTVTTPSQSGLLHLVEGDLIAAACGDQRGDGALHAILNWDDPGLEVDYLPFDEPRTISAGLMSLLMESQRLKDTIRSDTLQMRKHARHCCLVAVDFNLAGTPHRHLIRDLSEGGAFVAAAAQSGRGEEIDLSLYSLKHQQRCAVRGRIVRVEPHGYAVQFRELDDAQRAFVRGELD